MRYVENVPIIDVAFNWLDPLMKFLASFLCVALMIGCGREIDQPRAGKDITVLVSQDQRFKAALREVDISGSVMVSQWYQLIVESLIPAQPKTDVMLSASRTEGLKLRWRSPELLEVCYGDAQITGFRNRFVAVAEESHSINEFEIVLVRQRSLADCP